MRPPDALWHYTCEHGYAALTETGVLVPGNHLGARVPTGSVVWVTDLQVPIRDGLGLTQVLAKCDRTAYRYRVTDASTVIPWTRARRTFPPVWRHALEHAPGARPRHWFVSSEPVPVVLDMP